MGNWYESIFSGDNWYDATSAEHHYWWHFDGWDESDWWDMSHDVVIGEWIEGQSRRLPIFWYEIESIIPVSTEKEITHATVIPRTTGHKQGGYFDDFELLRSLEYDKLYGPEVTHIPLEETNDAKEIVSFGLTRDYQILAVSIVPQGSVLGDDTNYMVLRLRNKASGGDIATKTYIKDNDLEAFKVDRFGPVSPFHNVIDADQGLSLVVEKVGTGFTIPRSLIIIEWDLA